MGEKQFWSEWDRCWRNTKICLVVWTVFVFGLWFFVSDKSFIDFLLASEKNYLANFYGSLVVLWLAGALIIFLLDAVKTNKILKLRHKK